MSREGKTMTNITTSNDQPTKELTIQIEEIMINLHINILFIH